MRQHGVRQVPLLFCLSIAASLLGASLLVEPTLSERSAALSVMPVWGVLLWGAIFLGGGASTVHGLRAHRPDYESAGCTLQGFAYLAAAIVTVFSDSIPPSPLGIAFLAALAAGFIWRGMIVRDGG